jgi:hypothetical protein
MKQQDGNDGPRKDSNNGRPLWEWVVLVLCVVFMVLAVLYVWWPQYAMPFQNISNSL